jgi:uroporphyrinogen-III decarboxylase
MDNLALWQERYHRIQNAILLKPVDQIPVIYMGVAFAPRYMGMSIAEFCADPDAALDVTLAAMDKMGGWDGCNNPAGGRIAPTLTSIWLSHIAQPGIELPVDSLWQVQEAEVMTIEDYDTILSKGWNAFFMEFLPRVINPQEFLDSGAWMMANGERRWKLYQDKGYVIVCDAPTFATIPFEYLCGGRSMTKFFFDLYRMPDKVEAVMNVMMEEMLAGFAALPPSPGIAGAWVGGWRAASALVAPKLWNRFVWPYYLKVVDALIAKGITPVLHWDQDWTRDLVRLQELPAKKCILNPDGMTDLKKFKELAGDRMAMMGDIPASMLVAGTPDDVYQYTQGLIELFDGKGLLLCPGCDAPINAKPENMEAIAAAAHDYGKVAA